MVSRQCSLNLLLISNGFDHLNKNFLVHFRVCMCVVSVTGEKWYDNLLFVNLNQLRELCRQIH